MLGPAAHLTHRGVQIHSHLPSVGRRAHRPRPAKRQLGRFVELAHMPERERPQERPRSRRRHHLKGQHRTRRARPQPVGVIDAAAAHQHRRRHRQHLAARARARRAAQTHRVVDQRLQPNRSITVAGSNNPASATKDPSSNTGSNPSIPPGMLLTGSASSRGQNHCCRQQHSPMSGGLSGGRANPLRLTASVDPG